MFQESIHCTHNLLLCAAIGFLIFSVSTAKSNCFMWHYYLSENRSCVCGSTLEDVIVCDDTLGVVGVLNYYCLTSDGDQSVVGNCPAVNIHKERLLSPLGRYKRYFQLSLNRIATLVVFSIVMEGCVVSANLTPPYMPILMT